MRPGEQPVEEAAQQLVDHLFLRREVVVQAAGQDARRVGDIAHGGGAQPALGEHRGGELEQLGASTDGGGIHGCWLDIEITSPVR